MWNGIERNRLDKIEILYTLLFSFEDSSENTQIRPCMLLFDKTDVALYVSACVFIVPGSTDCQFPTYLWQSRSSSFQYEAKRWTSRTLYPADSSINWTSRQDIEVMPSQLTVKDVTKAVCFDSNSNTTVVCDRKVILYHVECQTVGHSGVYRVHIHGAGQVIALLLGGIASCITSDSAYSYTFLLSVVCLSAIYSCALCKPLDGLRCCLAVDLRNTMTHCVTWKFLLTSGRGIWVV